MKRTWHNNGPKKGLYYEIVSDKGDVIETAGTKTADSLVLILNGLEARADRDAELFALRELARKHETDRDRADAYELDLTEIGKVLGCNHLDDGLERCVSDVVEQRDVLLAACEDALATGERDIQHCLDNGRLRDVLRAAISKAKGHLQ